MRLLLLVHGCLFTVNTFGLLSRRSSDPTPDLMDISPNGKYVYAALRGPCPVSGNEPPVNNSVGATPGVGVIRVPAPGGEAWAVTGPSLRLRRTAWPSSAGAARRSSPSGDLHFTKPERERCLSAPGSL